MTAIVSTALQQFSQTTAMASAINKATLFLIAHQNTDGGFGSSPSTVYETALTYKALANVITDATVLGNAINYLTANQAFDGSWNEDPYSTALALQALYLFETRPVIEPPPPPPTTGTVGGAVMDASTNQSLSGATAALVSNPSLAALTNGSGSFSIANIPAGSQQITFTLNGYATTTATVSVTAGAIINIGNVPLSAAPNSGIIQGTVTDASNGSPLSGVLITVTGSSTWTATTAANGTFKIINITPGNVTITASKSSYTLVTGASTVTAGDTMIFSPSLTVTPPPALTGGLQGTVVDLATGLPLQGATVSVTGPKSYTGSTDSAGNFLFSTIDTGSYSVTVSLTGYGVNSYSIIITSGVTANLGSIALTLNPTTGTIQGTVTDSSTNAPISGAAITVSGSGAGTAVTAPDGSYQLSGISPGTITLSASKTGYGAVTGTGTITVGGTLVYNIALTPAPVTTTELKGVLSDNTTNQPVSNAVVTLTLSGTGAVSSAASDASGAFIFHSLDPGTYAISVAATGYISQTGTLTIVANVVNNVGTIQLTPAPTVTTITGTVTDAVSGLVLPNADVSVVGTSIAAKTDSTGSYTLADVIALAFVVKASATGYDSRSYNVTTTAYGAYTVDFALSQSQTGELRVTSLITDKQSYSANENMLITATIENSGSAAVTTIVQAHIIDGQENVVAFTKPAADTTSLPFWTLTIEPLSSVTVTMPWNTARFAPGDHQVNVKVTMPAINGSI